MKKQSKNVQLLLLVAVVAIWGLVIIRFRQYGGEDSAVFTTHAHSLPVGKISVSARDSLFILVNYPDPFLSPFTGGEQTLSRSAKERTRSIKPVFLPASPLPAIQYQGFSKDKDARKLARLIVAGKPVTLAEGERYELFSVTAIYRDSVQITREGRPVTIARR